MIKRIDELPMVLTCFAYRSEYFAEIDGMLVTVKEHHPDWIIVSGKGPIPGVDSPAFEVHAPSGPSVWNLPVPLKLDGSENDWRRVTRIKAWWMAQVWRFLDEHSNGRWRRILWLDADARLNGPLDIEVDPEAELIAAPVDYDPDYPDIDTICSGLLLLQGKKDGIVRTIVDKWSAACLEQIQELRPPTVPWLDSDQDVLNEVMESMPEKKEDYALLKLEHDKYAAYANRDGTTLPGALVDQWQMSRKMKYPECRERNWPPPEHVRRQAVRTKQEHDSKASVGPLKDRI